MANVEHLTDADIDRLRLVVLRLARRIRTHSVEEITPSQLAVLGTVVRHERLTVGQIADIEHVKPPSVSKIVAALEQAGYLAREHDREDRRCVRLTATPAGLDYVETVRAAGRSWLATQLTTLDDADLRIVGGAVPALERLLEGPDGGAA